MNFAILGVGGYIAPKHLRAIHETGGRVVVEPPAEVLGEEPG